MKPIVRTVHHFACTGGTLFSRCLAAMPNAWVLSEIDPLSTMMFNPLKPRFAPTDLNLQLRQSGPGCSQALLLSLFDAQMGLIAQDAQQRGLSLILRDHSHSHFCVGETVPQRPTLVEILATQFEVRSIVTVRHPIDSYSSLQANKWLSFEPATLDEYCQRYLRFLDAHAHVAVFRYEDLVADAAAVMNAACAALDVCFDGGFTEHLEEHHLTGDSGRHGATIAPRPRRVLPTGLLEEAASSQHFASLIQRLGYQPPGSD